MVVYLRFLAFNGSMPRSFEPFSLPDGSKAEDLLTAIHRQWIEADIGTNEERDYLANHALLASEGKALRPDERLQEGQRISVIGPILGG